MSCRSCGYNQTRENKWPSVNGFKHCPQCEEFVEDSNSDIRINKDIEIRNKRKEKEKMKLEY
ncbi:MAG: hypothetical protein AABY32_04010 [Nanoarchaeota archaeon]